MISENLERNSLIYELWKEGYTIDEISFETGIPRSTVGYYVRKFNKRAKRGEPIAFQPVREKPNDETLVTKSFLKAGFIVRMVELAANGDIDRVYKSLMVVKLMKELQREIFTTEEEKQAFSNILKTNPNYILELLLPDKLKSQ